MTENIVSFSEIVLHKEENRVSLVRKSDGKAFVSISELAHWCEVDHQAIFTATKRTPKELKTLLGGRSFTATRFENPDSPEPWTCVTADDAYTVLFYYAHRARGNETRLNAKALHHAMGKAGATVYIYGLCGYSVVPTEKLRSKEQILADLVLREPASWEQRFSADWIQNAERVTGWRWSYRVMGKFINRAVYDSFPKEIRDALDEYNPLDSVGNRKSKQYNHLQGEALAHLDTRIAKTLALLECADTKEEFFDLLAIKDRNLKQMNLFRLGEFNEQKGV